MEKRGTVCRLEAVPTSALPPPILALNLCAWMGFSFGGCSMHGIVAIVGLVVAVAALGLQWVAFRRNR